jgi:hypothetical protein
MMPHDSIIAFLGMPADKSKHRTVEKLGPLPLGRMPGLGYTPSSIGALRSESREALPQGGMSKTVAFLTMGFV